MWISQARTYPFLNAASEELMTMIADRRAAAEADAKADEAAKAKKDKAAAHKKAGQEVGSRHRADTSADRKTEPWPVPRALYTPAMLAAAAGLANWPWDEALPLRGEARSRSCGSTIGLALRTDADGTINGLGLRPHACAVGQAAASVFAEAAIGRDAAAIAAARCAGRMAGGRWRDAGLAGYRPRRRCPRLSGAPWRDHAGLGSRAFALEQAA
jgi:hypothetical protein